MKRLSPSMKFALCWAYESGTISRRGFPQGTLDALRSRGLIIAVYNKWRIIHWELTPMTRDIMDAKR